MHTSLLHFAQLVNAGAGKTALDTKVIGVIEKLQSTEAIKSWEQGKGVFIPDVKLVSASSVESVKR